MDPRNPHAIRRALQWLAILTIVLLATQTLLHQWGYGSDWPAEASASSAPSEKFVPAVGGGGAAATVEMRDESTVCGSDVRLKNVVRWAKADTSAMANVADLVVAKIPADRPGVTVSLDEVRQTLRDAGANLAQVNFAGAMQCTVSRSVVGLESAPTVQQWTEALDAAATTRPVKAVTEIRDGGPADAAGGQRSLRDVLLADLSERVGIDVDALVVRFNPQDEAKLRLVEPHFTFSIEPRRVRNLGDVTWDVTINAPGGRQKAQIAAFARAWQAQALAARPIAARQVLRTEDVIERRTMVDKLADEPLLSSDQVVSQQAARDLPAGTVLTARMVEAVPLVRPGQLMTISVEAGQIEVKAVAEARETGVYGQTIRVRKPGTRDEFNVVVTGRQIGRMAAPNPTENNLAAVPR